MNQELETKNGTRKLDFTASRDFPALGAAASATLVNRTHRVVRERANTIQAQKSRIRSLLIPLIVSAGLLVSVVIAAWVMLDEYDVTPLGLPEPGQQLFVFMLWCLPISALALAVVAFRRAGSKADSGGRG
jgi:hypothetical protein